MAKPEQTSDKLLVALHDKKGFVRVQGRGSFKVSSALKQFGVSAIEEGAETLVFDMSECVGMDSTFMGVIAGLAFRLKESGNQKVVMVNLSNRTRGLLATLGLDQLVQPYMAGSTPDEYEELFKGLTALNSPEEGTKATAEMMLEAHENLVELTPENLPRFKDVLLYLREDLKKAGDSVSKKE